MYIVEGEFDVWALERLGIQNVIGIYGISNIPKDIAKIFAEVGVASFMYLADNDTAGEKGASNLRTLLQGSEWKGEGEYRRFAGASIPEKGDGNDLLCHHFPDFPAARAALDSLPRFVPRLKCKPAAKPLAPLDSNQAGWDAVNEAITNKLGLIASDFKPNGFTKKNFRCVNPQHEDKEASAGWSRNGFYKCFYCGKIDSWQIAEWLKIDWRALLRPRPQIVTSTAIDLNAAPGQAAASAPLAFDIAPDSWLRTLINFYEPTEAVLFHYALRLCRSGPLAEGFTRDEFIMAARPLGCNLKEDTIKKFFKAEVYEDDNHPVFAKVDPGDGATIRKCKFRLRALQDIKRRLLQGICYRVYENTFRGRQDTLIGFKAFDEALPGSKYA
ncbi:MAG: toprim domain-containing protein [Chloroflexi bacterium]|nr:toprim domain-containing protein [Chloroflexota bacterium]